MNILFVNEIPMNPLYGGIERVTDLLAKEFHRHTNYNVLYLCTRVDNDYMLDYDFPAQQLVLPYSNGFNNDFNLEYYKEILIEHKIDVVINQRGWAPFMGRALNLYGVPTISVIHCIPKGAHVMYMNGILRHNHTVDGWIRYICKLLIFPLYYLYKYSTSIIRLRNHYKDLTTRSSAVVLLSKKCKQEFDNIIQPFKPHCNTYTIPNPNPYEHAVGQDVKKENIILFVGRLSSNEKNPMRLLKIWEKLYKSNIEWKLIFIGDGDALNEMQEYVSRRLIERVEFLGQKKNVDEYYSRSDFICLTSNFEGWGMTLVEGMSYGCIPFTFDNYGAASEIIEDNVNGCLIPPYNLDSYAARLSELIQNSDLRKQMSEFAREKAKDFSVTNIIKKWIDILNQMRK